jgi:acetyl-CoA carboxylase alpha subunit
LEEYAYSLIEGESTSAISWERFTEAKALAEVKRTEAQQDLLRLRGQSSNVGPM